MILNQNSTFNREHRGKAYIIVRQIGLHAETFVAPHGERWHSRGKKISLKLISMNALSKLIISKHIMII